MGAHRGAVDEAEATRTGRSLSRLRAEESAYAGDAERPLKSYAATMTTYGTVVLGLAALVRHEGGLPDRLGAGDLALMSMATHKVARLLSKDPITSPLRAAFTTYEGVAGPSELKEEVRGHGWRHSVGELLTCPFCLGQWVATGFTFGFILRPRVTRMIATVFTAVAASDFLQFAYAAAEHKAEG